MIKKEKILIIRMNAIGDIAHSTIIPYAIKLKHPSCKIHYLTSSNNKDVVKNCPFVDEVIECEKVTTETIINLFKQRYDLIISLNYTLKSYLLTFLSFPKKIVFRSFKGDSWVKNYFYTAKKAFKSINLPRRLYLENEYETEFQMAQKLSSYKRPYFILNPGKYHNQIRQGRIWNIEKYKELTKYLLENYDGTVFVNGSKDEREYHLELQNTGAVVLSGTMNLKESCAFLSLADLVISGDSGPIHLASAYNVRTLAILGSTSPDKIKPYGLKGDYIEPKTQCKYCWKKKCKFLKDLSGYAPCIESIDIDSVIEKIESYNFAKRSIASIK